MTRRATAADHRPESGRVKRPSLSRRLLLSVFVVLVVFFGLTVSLLDYLFREVSERNLRESARCADGGADRRRGSRRP